MQTTPLLKLVALDADDLAVISAHVQDSVLKVGDIAWLPAEHRFALAMNRFAWEVAEGKGRRRDTQRHRAALHFDRVLSVRTFGIDRNAADAILSLLAVAFDEGEAPGGEVRLFFAGGAEIRLLVEVIEAQLADLGAAWQTKAVPAHDLADAPAGAISRPK